MKKNIIITAIIVGIIIVIELFIAGVFSDRYQYLERLYYISQIFNCIVVVFGVVYAAWQYYLSVADSKRQADMVRVQKAIDLSLYFKDNILEKYPPIKYIFDQAGINNILVKIPSGFMKAFDYQEMRRYITEDDSEQLKRVQESNDFLMALIDANTIYGMHFELNTIVNNVKDIGENKKEVTFSIAKTPVINTFMRDYINQTLNDLEFFALHFMHNTADSSVVYQSLHQVYIEVVEQLYYFIATLNTDSVEKYYTNTIGLYHRWIGEKTQNDKKRIDNDKQLQTHGTVIK